MSKKILSFLFLILFTPFIVNAQNVANSKGIKFNKKPAFKDVVLPASLKKTKIVEYPVKNNPAGDTVATTTYGVFTNTTIRPQITFWNGVPQMSPMIFPSQEGNRAVTYIRPENGVYKATELPMGTSNNRSGWGAIDVARTGAYAGTIGIVAHSPNYLFLWDGTSFVKSPAFNPDFYPSFVFSGDNIFLAASGSENTVPYKMYKTSDLGTSFSLFDSITHYTPKDIFWVQNGSTEVDMSKSPDEKNIVYAGCNVGSGAAFDGIAADSCDNTWILYSTDSGANWTPKEIAIDGNAGMVENYPLPYFAPLIENFSQISTAVDNNGILHVVANGYGASFNLISDTLFFNKFSYPVLYWNSNTQKWISISNINVDTIQALGDIWDLKPAADRNLAFGQSFPALSVSEDGKVLLCTWTGPQITNGKIDTVNNEMYLDTYYAYSGDGGNNWTYGGVLNGKKNVAEAFCHPARQLEKTDAGYIAHLFYLENPPSPFLSSTGTGPVCNLIYRKFNLTLTGIDDKKEIVRKFDLEQNYPNPFNPATTIKYSVPENSYVTLKIYDMLGREISTLVNETKSAGSYNAAFNASKLASGLYIYTLKAGELTLSKKMMLMK